MKCPKCKTVDLKKSGFNSPHFCDTCGGMWVMAGERSDLPSLTLEAIETPPAPEDHDLKTGMCPSGHGIMIRAKVDIDEPFYLEKCTACGGIWFDKGEWQRIAENNLAENLSNIWSVSWQRKKSREKNRESFLQMNQALLGDPIFSAIMEMAERLKDHPEKDRAIALLQREAL